MKLSELDINDNAYIVKVKGRGAFRKRITEMGFVKGKSIKVIKYAPLRDPIEYSILGYEVSLRKSEAELIEVVTSSEAKKLLAIVENQNYTVEQLVEREIVEKKNVINVALVGNPNCGKTTFFNYASGAKEHVGNYSGVTVDAKTARFKYNNYTFIITDLPGTYSLTAYSPEELFVREYITDQSPDVVINMIDASNLERNMYLTTQLIDMDIKMVIGLNMYDELQQKGDKFDYISMGKMIGIPFVPIVSSKGKGIAQLFEQIITVFEDQSKYVRHIHLNYGEDVEKAIDKIQHLLKKPDNLWITDKISSRFLALKILEKDKDALKTIGFCKNNSTILKTAQTETIAIENLYSDDIETVITNQRYGFISGALKETYKAGNYDNRNQTKIIDKFLTNRVLGFPVFIFFMWVTFQATFTLGQYPMDWIEQLVAFVNQTIDNLMPAGMFKDLVIDGIIGGVGGVIVFLPNILLLFFFISLMEDSGYMARVAFIMDKIMHRIGLHGKSFIPLIMGFGCNVPAIMASRTLENRTDRILTMIINPFMSCSARLPVYLVIAGAFFSENAGNVIFSLYILGILLASLFALIFRKTIFKTAEAPFVMELPPYRIPTVRSLFKHMWHKGQQYLKKMGGIILIASILIWALGYFPQHSKKLLVIDNQIKELQNNSPDTAIAKITELTNLRHTVQQENSIIGKMGKAIEPIIAPLGFDWKLGVSILSGIAAKEIVVSTMGVLYKANTNGSDVEVNLQKKLVNETYTSGPKTGQKVITPLAAYSFLVFILLYFPCIAVIAAIKKETGSWKWPLFTIIYTTVLAYVMSLIIYQVGSLFI